MATIQMMNDKTTSAEIRINCAAFLLKILSSSELEGLKIKKRINKLIDDIERIGNEYKIRSIKEIIEFYRSNAIVDPKAIDNLIVKQLNLIELKAH